MDKTIETDEYRQYLRQLTAVQTETIRRLLEADATPPLELAAMLEDMANVYLDISDNIRALALGWPLTELRCPPVEADDQS